MNSVGKIIAATATVGVIGVVGFFGSKYKAKKNSKTEQYEQLCGDYIVDDDLVRNVQYTVE